MQGEFHSRPSHEDFLGYLAAAGRVVQALGYGPPGVQMQPEFEEGFVEGLFVNVAEHTGEGKYRTVSDVWVKVKGREGGREEWIRSVPYGVWRALRKRGNPQ